MSIEKPRKVKKRAIKLMVSILIAVFATSQFFMGIHDMDRGYNTVKFNSCELLGLKVMEEDVRGGFHDGPSAYMMGLTQVIFSFPFMVVSLFYAGLQVGGIDD